MLGRAQRQPDGLQDEALRETARALGASARYGPAPLGIYFGAPGVTVDDPYFDDAGPARTGCRLCGGCIGVGCPHGAKNSLDQNYLHLGEARGAAIHADTEAWLIRPLDGGGYAIDAIEPGTRRSLGAFEAPRVVLAAGALGSVALLARSREAGALPGLSGLSPRLGETSAPTARPSSASSPTIRTSRSA
jgi:cholesterol oxidase